MNAFRLSPQQQFSRLHAASPAILPSLLLCDFGNLQREVEQLTAAGVPGLHLDVMDGVFVPNLTYGMPIVAAFRELSDLPLDVHLMIANPEKYVGAFADAGADVITVHIEATDNPRELLQSIRQREVAAGIALNPDTPLESLDDCLDVCDLVLVMSVNAGFGGQQFNPVALEKLESLRQRLGDGVVLEVDGGVNAETVARCAEAGADWFVAGSAIFKAEDYRAAVGQLRELATRAAS